MESVAVKDLKSVVRRVRQLPISNIGILVGVYCARLLAPLFALPLLSHRLDESHYGNFLFTLSLSLWISIFVEYGFNISSTREIASTKDKQEITNVVAGTQSARLLVFILGTIPFAAMVWAIPTLHERSPQTIAAYLIAFLMGAVPLYYFQGTERLKLIGSLELTAALCYLAGVLLFVNHEGDVDRALLVYGFSRLIVFCPTTYLVAKEVGRTAVTSLNTHKALTFLKNGFHLFIFQGAVSLYTSFNTVFLGLFASSADVGVYATAERIVRAAIGVMGQVSFAIFPRLAAIQASLNNDVHQLRRIVLAAMFLIAIVGTLILNAISTQLSQFFLGSIDVGFIKIISILIWSLPAVALSNVLGFQYLILERRETIFNRLIFASAFASISAGIFIVPKYHGIGISFLWVSTEWLIALGCGTLVWVMQKRKIKGEFNV